MNSIFCREQRDEVRNYVTTIQYINKMKALLNNEIEEDPEKINIVFQYTCKMLRKYLVNKYKTNNKNIISNREFKRKDITIEYIERRINNNKRNKDKLFDIILEIEIQLSKFRGTPKEVDRYITVTSKCISYIEQL